jgi:hypothetical protein
MTKTLIKTDITVTTVLSLPRRHVPATQVPGTTLLEACPVAGSQEIPTPTGEEIVSCSSIAQREKTA